MNELKLHPFPSHHYSNESISHFTGALWSTKLLWGFTAAGLGTAVSSGTALLAFPETQGEPCMGSSVVFLFFESMAMFHMSRFQLNQHK